MEAHIEHAPSDRATGGNRNGGVARIGSQGIVSSAGNAADADRDDCNARFPDVSLIWRPTGDCSSTDLFLAFPHKEYFTLGGRARHDSMD